jgi:hypothetical protein
MLQGKDAQRLTWTGYLRIREGPRNVRALFNRLLAAPV